METKTIKYYTVKLKGHSPKGTSVGKIEVYCGECYIHVKRYLYCAEPEVRIGLQRNEARELIQALQAALDEGE